MSKFTRYIAHIALLAPFLFLGFASAQELASPLQSTTPQAEVAAIPAEKKMALDDLADSEISDGRRIELADMVSTGLQKAIRAEMDQRISAYTSLSNDQRRELENYRENLASKISDDISTAALMAVTKLSEFVHEQAYQIYGNELTQDEIIQIAGFYKTQAGQKYLMGTAIYPTAAQLESGANLPDNYWTQSELSALEEFEKTTASNKIKYLNTHTKVDNNQFTGEGLRPMFVPLCQTTCRVTF